MTRQEEVLEIYNKHRLLFPRIKIPIHREIKVSWVKEDFSIDSPPGYDVWDNR